MRKQDDISLRRKAFDLLCDIEENALEQDYYNCEVFALAVISHGEAGSYGLTADEVTEAQEGIWELEKRDSEFGKYLPVLTERIKEIWADRDEEKRLAGFFHF